MPLPESRPSIRSARMAPSQDLYEGSRREPRNQEYGRSGLSRASTFEGPTQLYRESPLSSRPMSRVPSDGLDIRAQRSQLRPLNRINTGADLFNDPSDDSTLYGSSSPDRSYEERSQRSTSPATSYGSAPSRKASSSTLNVSIQSGKKQAPPPPPSRAKKGPPPPPPPMKRSALSSMNVSYA